jgi:myo-inositol-1(or 4)-monophosphatase
MRQVYWWTGWQLAALEQRQRDLALLREAALAAGKLLRDSFGTQYETWSKGAAGPVTEIDLAADTLLKDMLTRARPDYGWLSEETADSPERLQRESVFIVDPLDGTRSFINGRDDFCTALAISVAGEAMVGVVYNPIREEMFAGAIGLGATLNDLPCAPSDVDELEFCELAGGKHFYASPKWPKKWPASLRAREAPALAYALALVAGGHVDGLVGVGRKHEWDLAAGAALINAAGGRTSDSHGRKLIFNKPDARTLGVTASGAALHPLLLDRTALLPLPV